MSSNQPIQLERDCAAVAIPHGYSVVLRAGARVTVVQALGASFTVRARGGQLVRIDGKDADALGEIAPLHHADESTFPPPASTGEPEELERRVWDELRTCFDPEIPVNIVELGLIYRCDVSPLPDGGQQVAVTMSLTAPGCGMGAVLKRDIERKLRAVPGVRRASVDVVVDPPWDPSRMSEAARLQTGLF